MKAFIPAAGLGTRLKPWTDSHPKALFPVDGIPMLERVITKIHSFGINDITINCHHFSGQIKDFISAKGWQINISDESDELLETGGGLLKAAPFLLGDEPILVHNADILSNVDFRQLQKAHENFQSEATLLVSDRRSSRKLYFNRENRLHGWGNHTSGEYRPSGFTPGGTDREYAFSGIYIVSPHLIRNMQAHGWHGKFSIMDYFLSTCRTADYKAHCQSDLQLIDIGKPDALNKTPQK